MEKNISELREREAEIDTMRSHYMQQIYFEERRLLIKIKNCIREMKVNSEASTEEVIFLYEEYSKKAAEYHDFDYFFQYIDFLLEHKYLEKARDVLNILVNMSSDFINGKFEDYEYNLTLDELQKICKRIEMLAGKITIENRL